jgi:hypothetical protein
MAKPTVAVTGKLMLPTGDVIGATGKLIITLSTTKGHCTDDAVATTHYTITGSKLINPDAAGDVSFSLVPNDVITPAGTHYDVLYIAGDEKIDEEWTVASSPNPVDLKEIPKTTGAGVTSPYQIPTIAALPAAAADYAGLLYRTAGPPSKVWSCEQNYAGVWSWVVIVVGG